MPTPGAMFAGPAEVFALCGTSPRPANAFASRSANICGTAAAATPPRIAAAIQPS